jgi:enoyl-CoA hydratase/carnithine racemase
MARLLTARLTAATAHEAMVTGRRYGGPEAVAAGIVDEAVPAGQVLAAAAQRAGALAGKRGATVAAIKRGIYGDVVSALERGGALRADRASGDVGAGGGAARVPGAAGVSGK